ncbi:META domain-containing protein [Halomonas piscis]|uniref:META domain-containing protein n=1 Tax=Halomonas piscis TaxID=3031727 RepID=A0ABY9YZH1_9GAMM|nr:META domain-containing protein [Halomonas piscis]WNK19973.1 META domain-containing protein [Halomonas piscis]
MKNVAKTAGYSLLLGLALGLGGCAAQSSSQSADDTPDVALANTYWKLTDLADGPVADTEDNQREAHFVLHEDDQRVAGATGCNQLMGNYTQDATHIAFEQLATTMMACPQAAGAERAYLNALNQAERWEIDGKTLTLADGDNETLARFQAVHLY